MLHGPVLVAAAVATIWAAWTRPDPVESLAIAAVCTLVVLPVTWIHYPAALLPFGLVAASRSSGGPAGARAAGLLGLAVAFGVVGLLWLPLVWVGVAAFLAGVHASTTQPAMAPA